MGYDSQCSANRNLRCRGVRSDILHEDVWRVVGFIKVPHKRLHVAKTCVTEIYKIYKRGKIASVEGVEPFLQNFFYIYIQKHNVTSRRDKYAYFLAYVLEKKAPHLSLIHS